MIPSYTLFAVLGFTVSSILLMRMLARQRILRLYFKYCMISIIGLVAFAWLFGVVSTLLVQVSNGESVDILSAISEGGIVYFGGLLGYLFALALCCRIRGLEFDRIANIVAICIPLFHVFGRIGCYFAGCCYGVESDLFGLPYATSLDSNVTLRIPTQLIEAAFELIVAIVLFFVYKKRELLHVADGHDLLAAYLISYSVFRFLIEFARGDIERGVFLGLSFSQYICVILLIAIVIVLLPTQLNRKRLRTSDTSDT